jgi:hypothetical protein
MSLNPLPNTLKVNNILHIFVNNKMQREIMLGEWVKVIKYAMCLQVYLRMHFKRLETKTINRNERKKEICLYFVEMSVNIYVTKSSSHYFMNHLLK